MQGVGRQHGDVAPDRRRVLGGLPPEPERDVRHVEGHEPLVRLLERDVDEPGREHPRDVVQECGRGGEDLDVARPAEPFVALRAVGRDVDEVRAQAPDDVLVQPVQLRVRGAEPARALHVAVMHARQDVALLQVARPAVHLGVAVAVDREARLPRLRSPATEVVDVGGRGGAERACVELTVLQHLRVPQHDGAAGRPVDRDPQATRVVLPEVEQEAVVALRRDRHRVQFVDRADRGAEGRDQDRGIRGARRDRRPPGVGGARGGPAVHQEPGVELLALVEAGPEDRRGRRDPRVVGADHDRLAVDGRDLELHERRLVGAVEVGRPAVEPELAAPPSVAEPCADHVVAGRQVPGDVERRVPEAVLVARPPGRQCFIADAASVDLELHDAMGGHVGPRGCDLGVDPEGPAHQRRAPIGVVGRPAGEPGGPVARLEEPDLDRRGLAPPGPVLAVPHLHARRHPVAGAQRGHRPRHEDLLGGLDLDDRQERPSRPSPRPGTRAARTRARSRPRARRGAARARRCRGGRAHDARNGGQLVE